MWAVLAFFLSFPLDGQDIYWTTESRTAYSLLTSLRLDEGLSIIRLQKITHPENYIWDYLQDYAEFLKIFLLEDLSQIEAFTNASNARALKVAQVPESNPFSLMAQGQMSLHQCALHLQQGEFIQAATDISHAFKLLKKNQKLHPDDVANLRLYAALKMVFGSVPEQYRWLIAMFTSLQGTIAEGLKELNHILQTTTPATNIFYDETVIYTAIAQGRLNNHPDKGLALLKSSFGNHPVNRAVQFVTANLQIANGDTDGAIRTLTLPVIAPSAQAIPFMDFMLGECKLFRGDADADEYFERFLVYHRGKHFIKEAYQKLGWSALLRNDRAGYFHHMQQILIKGAATTDEDQQALYEAEHHATPHPVLLRSRLYYDGGYYDKALRPLTDNLYTTLNQQPHRLEFLYRKGRILQAQKAYAEALHYFSLTISAGQYEKSYFACGAALQCGIIHETLGSHVTASQYYYLCLEMFPDTYVKSLHQRARMGLNRIGE